MKELFYKIMGRAVVLFERVYDLAKGRSKKDCGRTLDGTGLNVTDARRLEVLRSDGVVFASYDSISHSFWRAQELSLFTEFGAEFKSPTLDFGCGDGSFAYALSRKIDYGVDHDDSALEAARKYGIYGSLLKSTGSRMPLPDGSVKTVMANSVLEHLAELDEMLSEIGRVLAPGGRFLFTVPVKRFKDDLARYFGRGESEMVNLEYYHRNLLDAGEWEAILKRHGFSVVLLRQYQPGWFTFWYKMLRVAGAFGRRGSAWVWGRYKDRLLEMVKESIKGTEVGDGIFVIAERGRDVS